MSPQDPMDGAASITQFLEVKVTLARVEERQAEHGRKLDTALEALRGANSKGAELAVVTNQVASLKEDVKSLKSNQTWVARTVIGAVLMAVLALVITSAKSF